jgi:hypothetical protein
MPLARIRVHLRGPSGHEALNSMRHLRPEATVCHLRVVSVWAPFAPCCALFGRVERFMARARLAGERAYRPSRLAWVAKSQR